MFQVPSHPSSFSTHGHGHQRPSLSLAPQSLHPSSAHYQPSSRAGASAAQTLNLPRTLSRPAYIDPSPAAIAAAAPDLAQAGVPPAYIRAGLRAQAPQMQAGISAIPSSHLPRSLQKSQVPQVLPIPVRPSSSKMYPTHVLAISQTSSSRSSGNEQTHLFPVHALVVAAQCASVPRLPPSSVSGGTASLPVLPLALPSAQAFRLLHAFLYTHSAAALLQGLIPLPSSFVSSLAAQPESEENPERNVALESTLASPQTLHALSQYLVSASSGENIVQALMAHAAHVKELWQDAVALGVHDPTLWAAMDLAWEVVLGAINLAAAA